MVVLEARGPGAQFGGSGLILEAREPSLKISGLVMIFGVAPARKRIPILGKQIFVLSCYFLMCFRVFVFLMFCDFGCPEAPFRLPF